MNVQSRRVDSGITRLRMAVVVEATENGRSDRARPVMVQLCVGLIHAAP